MSDIKVGDTIELTGHAWEGGLGPQRGERYTVTAVIEENEAVQSEFGIKNTVLFDWVDADSEFPTELLGVDENGDTLFQWRGEDSDKRDEWFGVTKVEV